MSSPAALSSLPDVLLQSIMQLLPCRELLRLARCARIPLRAALNPFARKYARLLITKPLSASAVFLRTPLLQSMPTMLRWRPDAADGRDSESWPDADHEEEHDASKSLAGPSEASVHLSRIGELSHVCQLWEVDFCCTDFDNPQWLATLDDVDLSHLRVFAAGTHEDCCKLTDALACRIQTMVHLESLQLLSLMSGAADWSWLAKMRCLASLTVLDSGEIEDRTILPMILLSCPRLTHLDMDFPALYMSDFVVAFATPVMRQLHSLTLRQYFAGLQWCGRRVAPSSKELTAGFAGMACLCSLTLDRIRSIDVLLPFVAHAPVLTLLSIIGISAATEGSCPSADVLRGLLTVAPALHCNLRSTGLDQLAIELQRSVNEFGPRVQLL